MFVQLTLSETKETTQTLINLDLKLPCGLKLRRAIGGVQEQYGLHL